MLSVPDSSTMETDRLEEIHAPALVICGCFNEIVPREQSVAVHKGIPNSTLLILQDSGHGVEGADIAIYQEAKLSFLSQLSR